MKIVSVSAKQFGPFVDRELALAPGLTLVWGGNEAGKSSWHAALYAGVCGMRRAKGGPRVEDRTFRERHRPWTAAGWEVGALVDLADGRRIRLQHDLDGRVDCTAFDDALGRDVSSEIMSDGAPDASRWLGLDRRAFLSVACVRQGEITSVRQDGSLLGEYLQRAAATAGTAETAAAAIARVQDALATHVGLDRAHSTKPLRRAADRVALAESRLLEAQREHAAYAGLVEEAERLRDAAEQVEQRLAKARRARAIGDFFRCRRRLARARDLQARYPEGTPAPNDDEEVGRLVAGALRGWETRPAVPELSGASVEDLERQIAGSPEPPTGDCEPHGTVVEAYKQLVRHRQALELHDGQRREVPEPPEPGGPAPEVLRDLARALEAPVPVLDPALDARRRQLQSGLDKIRAGRSRRVVVAIVAGVSAAAGAAALALGSVPAAIGLFVLAIGGAMWWMALGGHAAEVTLLEEMRGLEGQLGEQRHGISQVLRAQQLARERAAAMGVRADAAALRALVGRIDEAEHLRSEHLRWQEVLAGLAGRVTEAEFILGDVLQARGTPAGPTVDLTLAAYESACLTNAELAAEAARREGLGRELVARQAAERAAAEARTRRETAERELIDVAARCGIVAPDGPGLADALRGWQGDRAESLRQYEQAARECAELEQLLAGSSLEQLEREEAQLAARAADLAGDLPVVEAPPDDEGVLDEEVPPIEERARAAAEAVAEARGRVAQRARAVPSVPEAEEETDAARRELERVQALDATLRTTLDYLTRAQDRVHRDLAPQLAETMRRWLADVTDGRYVDVRVDPESLVVQVRGPDEAWRDASLLSQGTAEQIYLLLRIAMARHLAPRGETCPLVFDEVTVQSDLPRTEAMLRVLHALSREQQVILFSQEQHVLDWGERHLFGPQDQVVRLAPPPRSGTGGVAAPPAA